MTARTLVIGGASRAAIAWRRNAARAGLPVTVLTRKPVPGSDNETQFVVGDYFAPPAEVFDEVGCVMNFAGAPTQPTEAALIRLNVEGPVRLAVAARDRGAARFVQISSLSVFGGAEDIDDATPIQPRTSYARTKRAAEEGLRRLETSGFSPLIVRAPLIYGPQGGGKLSQLVRLWSTLRVLPAPSVLQPRSMVHVHNLALALDGAVDRGDRLIYPCDPEPFDLAKLRDALRAEGVGVRLFSAPPLLFRLLERARPAMYESLYGRSLVAPGSRAPLPRDAMNLNTALRGLIRAGLKRDSNA